MKTYRAVWRCVWGAMAVLAIGVACIAWTAEAVAVTFVLATITLWCTALIWIREVRRRSSLWAGSGEAVQLGVCGGAGVLAVVALADTIGAAAWLLLGLAAATSPPALRWVRRRLRAERRRCTYRRLRLRLDPAVEERAWEGIVVGELAEMSDIELCWAWRISFRALAESPDVEARTRVVRIRQAYLAELDRRHPEQVAAWLATCPRPAAGPERFLRSAS